MEKIYLQSVCELGGLGQKHEIWPGPAGGDLGAWPRAYV